MQMGKRKPNMLAAAVGPERVEIQFHKEIMY